MGAVFKEDPYPLPQFIDASLLIVSLSVMFTCIFIQTEYLNLSQAADRQTCGRQDHRKIEKCISLKSTGISAVKNVEIPFCGRIQIFFITFLYLLSEHGTTLLIGAPKWLERAYD